MDTLNFRHIQSSAPRGLGEREKKMIISLKSHILKAFTKQFHVIDYTWKDMNFQFIGLPQGNSISLCIKAAHLTLKREWALENILNLSNIVTCSFLQMYVNMFQNPYFFPS